MDQLLEQMLSTNILTEEVKKELMEAFTAELEKVKTEAKEQAVNEAKVEYAKQFADDKAALVEALDTKVTALLADEVQELKEDIERFRDLEAEYAAKLVEEKEAMGLRVKADMAQLVEELDSFLEKSLTEEFQELKESIEEVKKIDYAKSLFESIENTFKTKFFNENEIVTKLEENLKVEAEKSQNATKLYEDTKKQLDSIVRKTELARVLEPLHGRPREIMEAILKSVPTEKLDEHYTNFIGRVLHDSATVVENKSEKENATDASVLAESESTNEKSETVTENTVVVSGDSTVVENVEEKHSVLSEAELARFRRIAGIRR